VISIPLRGFIVVSIVVFRASAVLRQATVLAELAATGSRATKPI